MKVVNLTDCKFEKEKTKLKSDFVMFQTMGPSDYLSYENADRPLVFFTTIYQPPYNRFDLIRKIREVVRRSNPFNKEITLSIDLTEWLGHENEEYFVIFAKFLHDHRNIRNYIFTVNSADKDAISSMFLVLRRYLFGTLKFFTGFNRDSFMKNMIFTHGFSHDAAARFSDFVSCNERLVNDKLLVEQIVREIKVIESSDTVDDERLRRYFSNPNGLVCLYSFNIIKEVI